MDGPDGTGEGIIGAVTGLGGGAVLVSLAGGPPLPASKNGSAFFSPAMGAEDFDFDFFLGWKGIIDQTLSE